MIVRFLHHDLGRHSEAFLIFLSVVGRKELDRISLSAVDREVVGGVPSLFVLMGCGVLNAAVYERQIFAHLGQSVKIEMLVTLRRELPYPHNCKEK